MSEMTLGEALKRVCDHADSSIFEWNEQAVRTEDPETLTALAMDIHFMKQAVQVIRSANLLVHLESKKDGLMPFLSRD